MKYMTILIPPRSCYEITAYFLGNSNNLVSLDTTSNRTEKVHNLYLFDFSVQFITNSKYKII